MWHRPAKIAEERLVGPRCLAPAPASCASWASVAKRNERNAGKQSIRKSSLLTIPRRGMHRDRHIVGGITAVTAPEPAPVIVDGPSLVPEPAPVSVTEAKRGKFKNFTNVVLIFCRQFGCKKIVHEKWKTSNARPMGEG